MSKGKPQEGDFCLSSCSQAPKRTPSTGQSSWGSKILFLLSPESTRSCAGRDPLPKAEPSEAGAGPSSDLRRRSPKNCPDFLCSALQEGLVRVRGRPEQLMAKPRLLPATQGKAEASGGGEGSSWLRSLIFNLSNWW